MVAYDEDFDIRAEAVSTNETRIKVTPTRSGTTEDSYALSMHLRRILGGRYLPPLAVETTNLVLRIERQLRDTQAGRTDPLPPTPDTVPGYYLQFWTEMTIEEKHDHSNWKKMVQAWKELQASHNKDMQPGEARR